MMTLRKYLEKIVISCIVLTGFILYGQDDKAPPPAEEAETEAATEELPEEGWCAEGTFSFLFNQTAFDNWLAGGQNSIGGNASINYDLNYSKNNWTCDNKIIISYGLTKTEGTELRKTDDRLEFHSLVGKKASGYWSYSFLLTLRMQLTNGYDYNNDPGENFINSTLLNPAYLVFGPGIRWEKTNDLKFNMAPATSKVTLLGREVFTYNSEAGMFVSSNDVTTFGVSPGDRMRYEVGFHASGYYKFEAMENVSVENIVTLYSNYLEDPQNVDLNYHLNIVMKINKYLSANITFQSIYDDNAFAGFQLREVFGLGVDYGF